SYNNLIKHLKSYIMKPQSIVIVGAILIVTSFSCSREETPLEIVQTADLTTNEFHQAQAQIKETLDAIFESIQQKDADRLISFHEYGPKFTEFKDGERRTGPAENEAYERGLVAAVSAFDYDLHD